MTVEIEFKFRIEAEAQLLALETAAGGELQHRVLQTNIFFDTAKADLDKAKLVMRLREEREEVGKATLGHSSESRFFLTAKGPGQKSNDGTLSKKAEEEIDVSSDTAKALLSGEKDPLLVLGKPPSTASRDALLASLQRATKGSPLKVTGRFTNQRSRVLATLPIGDDDKIALLLEFDRTVFPGDIKHFEVEVEVSEAETASAAKAMAQLLAKTNIEGRAAPGKAKRFFQALRGEDIG